MKALILAAGRGQRLWPFTADRPKCLLSIAGSSILERQLRHLERFEIQEVVLICGFGIEQICKAVSVYPGNLRVKTLYNPFYAEADNLISLWAARLEMNGDFLLMNGDNLFHPGILQRLLDAEESCCLMIARKESYDDDDMKVHLSGDRIVRIGKDLAPEETDAESIGIMQFSGEGVDSLKRALEEILMEKRALRSFFLKAIQRMIDTGHPVHYRETGGLPWTDVDTPEDLRFARRHPHLYQDLSHPYEEVEGGV